MTERLKNTLANLYELANRGATEGEKAAARKAMERIINKHNLKDIDVDEISFREYRFKYSTNLEMWLINRLRFVLLGIEDDKIYRSNYAAKNGRYLSVREVVVKLNKFDYVTLECAYEYFRRHMKSQWNKTAAPVLKRCRKAKTRNKKREALQDEFFQQYCIASKLYNEDELQKREITSTAEYERARTFHNIEGGQYNKQVNNGLFLEG